MWIGAAALLCRPDVPDTSRQGQWSNVMQKIDLDAMSIEELAALRDNATVKLAEKVAARQQELEAELEKLSAYGGKPRKTPSPKSAKEPAKEQKDPVAKAA
jgi:hypothetical protein